MLVPTVVASRRLPPSLHSFLASITRYLKDGDPGVEDVVEVDGSLEGIGLAVGAVGVVLVPVDAGGVVGDVGVHVQVALNASFFEEFGHGAAVPHAVVFGLGADEGVLVIIFSVVVFMSQGALDEKEQRQYHS